MKAAEAAILWGGLGIKSNRRTITLKEGLAFLRNFRNGAGFPFCRFLAARILRAATKKGIQGRGGVARIPALSLLGIIKRGPLKTSIPLIVGSSTQWRLRKFSRAFCRRRSIARRRCRARLRETSRRTKTNSRASSAFRNPGRGCTRKRGT